MRRWLLLSVSLIAFVGIIQITTSSVGKQERNGGGFDRETSTLPNQEKPDEINRPVAHPPEKPNPRLVLEGRLKESKQLLLEPTYELGEKQAARQLTFDLETLRTHTLYLVNPLSKTDYLFIDQNGRVEREGRKLLSIEQSGSILLTDDGRTLFFDQQPFDDDVAKWRLFWVSTEKVEPKLTEQTYPSFLFRDGFMRLPEEPSPWKHSAGTWELNKHGGGMPVNEQQAASPDVARATNPFDMLGSDQGVLTCEDHTVIHGQVEARFYFGIPRTEKVVDANTLPMDTDMLVVLGALEGPQVAFGWKGELKAFVLLSRQGNKEWSVLRKWEGKRPPLTNWVKIGLELHKGRTVRGMLDGLEVVQAPLAYRVAGPFHVASGKGLIQVDDIHAGSLPESPAKGTPLYLPSRLFAPKVEKKGSDPSQFGEWAKGDRTFARFSETLANGNVMRFIASRHFLQGDFQYESIPHHYAFGDLPAGRYDFRFLKKLHAVRSSNDEKDVAFEISFERDPKGWTARNLDEALWPKDHREFTLRLRRRAEDGNRIAVKVGEQYIPVSESVEGPVHLAIGGVWNSDLGAEPEGFPAAEHHAIYCSNLVCEVFEDAPTEWSWLDGKFRMDCRWACFDQWNFMSCGSTEVPFMVSKTQFHGDQEHDYFVSLRPVFPWDDGDKNFNYDAKADRGGWKVFNEHEGWYNRRDLNFSFCSDGRNPLSGYALVFAGDDNTETRLLRKGLVVARTSDPEFLLPKDRSHHVIHWKWWHFFVTSFQGTVVVYLNDRKMFEYKDPEPLTGGHIGFWSVRNGFTLARVNSIAATLRRAPQVLYVEDDTAADIWKPLRKDVVTLLHSKETGKEDQAVKDDGGANELSTTVRLNSGAGFHGIRHTFPNPVDLEKAPVLELPIKFPPGLKLNLHLSVSGQSYVVQMTAPLADCKSLLTPEYQGGEQFRIPLIEPSEMAHRYLLGTVSAESTIRLNILEKIKEQGQGRAAAPFMLQSITIGNTSNSSYLLAGFGGNRADMTYQVGTPTLRDTSNNDGR